jgi:hypothetical protein
MMSVSSIRRASAVLLLPLLAFYIWFTFRDDGALMTVPGVPKLIWAYFDHHTNQRNAVGFFILGALVSAMVLGARGHLRVLALAGCLVAPIAKDCAQIGLATRHFNMGATLLGVIGALIGFYAADKILNKLCSRSCG